MAYLSPLFIPCMLFEKTKEFFSSWLKLFISFALQPAIIAAFIGILFSMYDNVLYGKCNFISKEHVAGSKKFTTFEMTLPESEQDRRTCVNSFGYKMKQYANGEGWSSKKSLFTKYSVLSDSLQIILNLLQVAFYSFIFYYLSSYINRFISDITSGLATDSVTNSPMKILDSIMDKGKNLVSGIKARRSRKT